MGKVKYYYDSDTLSYRKFEPKKSKIWIRFIFLIIPYCIGLSIIGWEIYFQNDFYRYKKDKLNMQKEREAIYITVDKKFEARKKEKIENYQLIAAAYDLMINEKKDELRQIKVQTDSAYVIYDREVKKIYNIYEDITNSDSLLIAATIAGEKVREYEERNKELKDVAMKNEIVINEILKKSNEQNEEKAKKESYKSYRNGALSSLGVALIMFFIKISFDKKKERKKANRLKKEEQLKFPFMIFCDSEEEIFFNWNGDDFSVLKDLGKARFNIYNYSLNSDLLRNIYDSEKRVFTVGEESFKIKLRK